MRHGAARACPYEAVATQGHTLPTAHFTATLAVEAAIHYQGTGRSPISQADGAALGPAVVGLPLFG